MTGWDGRLSLAVSASKFSKSAYTVNASSHFQYKTEKDLYLLLLNYDIIYADGENFDNRTYAHFRYNRKINELIRWEYFFQIQNNSLIKVEQRILNGTDPRLKLSEYENAKFYFGLAYMFEYEALDEPRIINRDHRLSSLFTFTLLPEDDISLINATYIQPLIDDFNDFRVANDTNLQFAITEKLGFSTVVTFLYDAVPPVGIPTLNYQIRNGLSYQF